MILLLFGIFSGKALNNTSPPYSRRNDKYTDLSSRQSVATRDLKKNANNVILGEANQWQNSVLFYSVAGNVIRNVVDLFCGLLSTVSSPPCSSII